MSLVSIEARDLSAPLPPFAQRMAGRDRGWGVVRLAIGVPHALPPTPTLPAASRGEGARCLRGTDAAIFRHSNSNKKAP